MQNPDYFLLGSVKIGQLCQCIIHEKQVNYTTHSHVLYKGSTEDSKPVDFLVKLN